ncbi:hypothetical protein D3C77_323770 [compost metagenome]
MNLLLQPIRGNLLVKLLKQGGQLFFVDRFKQITFNTILKRLAGVLEISVSAQHDRMCVPATTADFLKKLQPIHTRHTDIDQYHIGNLLFIHTKCLISIGRRSHDLVP